MLVLRFIAVIMVLLTSACTTLITVRPTQIDNQNVEYVDGIAVISSEKTSSVFLMLGRETRSSEVRRNLFIETCNRSSERFDFSTDNITAYLDGESVALVPFEKLLLEIEEQEKWAKIAVAYAAANASSMAAMPSTNSGTFSVGQNRIGSPQLQGNYEGKSFNPAATVIAQQAVQNNATNRIQEIQKAADSQMRDATMAMLKKNTVSPGKCVSGYITLERIKLRSNPSQLYLSVSTGNESHLFSFVVNAGY